MFPSPTAEYEITSFTGMWQWCVWGKSDNRAELKSLSSSWIPLMQMEPVEPKPSPAMDLPVTDSPAQHSAIQGNLTGDNAHKQDKYSKDTGNTSSLIWITFSTKKSWGLSTIVLQFHVFQDKWNKNKIPFVFNVDFYKGTSTTEDLFFPMHYPMQLASTFWGSPRLM